MRSKKAIIIGSGIAGLAAAIRLAVKGMEVVVYEKNEHPGGKISAFEKQDYRFDGGPSLFTQPENIELLFDLAGEPMSDYFQYQPVDISCTYFYENGKVIRAFTEENALQAELLEKAGEPTVAVKKYLGRSKDLYNKVGTVFLDHSLHKKKTWLHPRVLKAFTALRYPYLFKTLAGYNEKHFSSPEVKQIFNRYATYNGSNPYLAPAMLSLIPHLELNQGTFYPRGGMISITNALYKLALKKGVQFNFNTPVSRIIHTDAKVQGVVVDNKNIFADIVISNADVYFTFRDLVGNTDRANRLLKQERSSSAIIFYWGMSKKFSSLGLHNIFFSNDYKQEFNSIFKSKTLYHDPTVYINITSKMETGNAPPGNENWFVMINAPSGTGPGWDQLKIQARKNIITKLERILGTGIEEFIEVEEVMDPRQIQEKTGSYMGALYGTSSNSKMAAFSRPPNFTSYVRGLYFCGGSVHPGGGIPLCLKSAMIVSSLIDSDYNNRRHA